MTSVIKDLIARGLMRSAARPANLPQLLATLPKDGVVCRVLPEEWVATGVNDSYYTITHSLLTPVRNGMKRRVEAVSNFGRV